MRGSKQGIKIFAVMMLLVAASCDRSHSYKSAVTDEEGCATAPLVAFSGESTWLEGELPELMSAAYFRVNVPADGAWYLLGTGNSELGAFVFDPVISIYSEDGTTRLASVDDGFVFSSTDPSFMYFATGEQSLCVKVESYQNWTQDTVMDEYVDFDLNYALGIARHPGGADVYDLAMSDGNDTVAVAVSVPMVEENELPGNTFSFVHGQLQGADDVDVYAFTTGSSDVLTDVYLNMRSGAGEPLSSISGSGTTAAVRVEIVDEDEQVLSSLELNNVRRNLTVLLAAETTYYLRIHGAVEWSPGINDFYSLLLYSGPSESSTFESEAANSTLDTAELLTLDASDSGYLYGWWFGTISDADDVDIYRLELSTAQYFLLYCKAQTMGSGIEELTVQLSTVDGETETLLQEGVEGDVPIEWSDGDASTDAYVLLPAGTTYLQIYGTPSVEPASDLYFCNIAVVDAAK